MIQPADFGINLVASLSGNVGLGVTARSFAAMLRKNGVPLVVADVGHDWGGKVPVADLGFEMARDWRDLRHPVNLYMLPLAGFPSFFQANPALVARRRMHVASVWWEASRLPPAWIEPLSRFDAVIVSSGFLADVAANELVLTPVIEAPHPLSLPPVVADRARFSLPADATVFTASFDPNSDPARKNPVAIVQAFRMAFAPAVAGVHLAIRMNNAGTVLGRATLEAMTRAAAGDARITFLQEPLEYQDVLSFYASGDVYVSLHRGEGLGLGLMESMAFGKPVIATAWSGNTSFMDYSCGAPVRYRTIPVRGNWDFFTPEVIGPQAFWAEPMVDDAAAWMARLHADPQARLAMGAAARARIEEYQARAWQRRWIDGLIALWQAQAFLPRAPGKLSALPG